MEAHSHGRILEVEFKNQYDTAHILIIVTYPPPKGNSGSINDNLRRNICKSITRIHIDFQSRMQELGKQGILIVLTDANSVADPTLDRPDTTSDINTLGGSKDKGDNLALLLKHDLKYTDTYRKYRPQGQLTTHTSARWKTSARLDQIWIKHIYQDDNQLCHQIPILAAGAIHTGQMLGSDHVPIAAIIPGSQLITHHPDPDLDIAQPERVSAKDPKALPARLTSPPHKIITLLANKRGMANIQTSRLNKVRGEITDAIQNDPEFKDTCENLINSLNKIINETVSTPERCMNKLQDAYANALDYLYATIWKHIKPFQRPPRNKLKRKNRKNGGKDRPPRQSIRNCTHTITALMLLIARWECPPHRRSQQKQNRHTATGSQPPTNIDSLDHPHTMQEGGSAFIPTHLISLQTICNQANTHISYPEQENKRSR
jgi:exonuclease III